MEEQQIQQGEVPKITLKIEEVMIEIPVLAIQDFEILKKTIDYIIEKVRKDIISNQDFKQYLIHKKAKRENSGLSYIE